MPFDKISPQMLFVMRIITGLSFLGLGAALAVLAGQTAVDAGTPGDALYFGAALTFGAFMLNAGMMLLELVTKPPFKVAINVPFVAGAFQTALVLGLVAVGLTIARGGETGAIQALVFAGFALNLVFVTMTKMHWNFTENTGKALPKA